jgi:hypothetical protein
MIQHSKAFFSVNLTFIGQRFHNQSAFDFLMDLQSALARLGRFSGFETTS